MPSPSTARGSAVPAAPNPASGAQLASEGSHWERPPKQRGNNLNVILLVSDTFRADNLAAYGSQWVETPNLNRLAEESVIFEDAYPEGMPTIPIRRTLYTGRRIVPTRSIFQHEPVQLPGWHHLYNEDVTISEVLTEAGYATALIGDLPHLQRPGRNFHRGYKYYEWVRGQENDYYALAPRKQPDYLDLYPADYLERSELNRQFAKQPEQTFKDFLNQYTANRRRWRKDGESIVELTAGNAIRWLKENHTEGPFFLHVEAFDPHEPWDPPQEFLEKYLKNPEGPSWPEPPYANTVVPPEGVKRLRANYAGEASNVDYWFGKILETAKELNLLDNTVVVFSFGPRCAARGAGPVCEGAGAVTYASDARSIIRAASEGPVRRSESQGVRAVDRRIPHGAGPAEPQGPFASHRAGFMALHSGRKAQQARSPGSGVRVDRCRAHTGVELFRRVESGEVHWRIYAATLRHAKRSAGAQKRRGSAPCRGQGSSRQARALHRLGVGDYGRQLRGKSGLNEQP